MELFFISFVIIGLAFLGMATGVLLGRSSIKGSCGGLSAVGGQDGGCPVCGATRDGSDTGAGLERLAKCDTE